MKRSLIFFASNVIFSYSLAALELPAETTKELDQYFSQEHLADHRKGTADCVAVITNHQKAVYEKDTGFRRSINQLATLEDENGVERSGCLTVGAREKLLYNLYWEASIDVMTPYLRTKIAEQEKILRGKKSKTVADVTDPKDNAIVQMPTQTKGKWSLKKQKLSSLSKYEIYRRIFNYYDKTPMPYSKDDEENSAFIVYFPKPVNGTWHMVETKLSDIGRWELYNNLYAYYQALGVKPKS